jgi:hypothetical protein
LEMLILDECFGPACKVGLLWKQEKEIDSWSLIECSTLWLLTRILVWRLGIVLLFFSA